MVTFHLVVSVNLFVDLGIVQAHQSVPHCLPPLCAWVCFGDFLEPVFLISFTMCFIFAKCELIANKSVFLSVTSSPAPFHTCISSPI